MIKYDTGIWIGNYDGRQKEIIAESTTPCKPKDLAIGLGLILAGVIAGIAYISTKSFKHGADSFNLAETKVLNDLDLLSNDGSVMASKDGREI